MKVRRRTLQVFSVSFLDVLGCALGGVLLLWILSMTSSQRQAAALTEALQQSQAQNEAARDALDEVARDLEEAERNAEAFTEAYQSLKKAQGALIGFEGKMENVVFVFDTSGSMAGPNFDYYKQMLQGWVREIAFKKFNIVQFGDNATVWRLGEMVDGSPQEREEGVQFVNAFVADSSETRTDLALEKAMRIPGVDTIILMTDGHPVPKTKEEVLTMVARENQGKDIVINCIAMGPYYEHPSLLEFLKQLAGDTEGAFIGR